MKAMEGEGVYCGSQFKDAVPQVGDVKWQDLEVAGHKPPIVRMQRH